MVVSGNLPALRLYAGLGFVEYGLERRATKYRGRYHDEVLMALPLVIGSDTSVPRAWTEEVSA
jgi:RimJ/RimL family protein N-acetyltransferase